MFGNYWVRKTITIWVRTSPIGEKQSDEVVAIIKGGSGHPLSGIKRASGEVLSWKCMWRGNKPQKEGTTGKRGRERKDSS